VFQIFSYAFIIGRRFASLAANVIKHDNFPTVQRNYDTIVF